uniref:Uncharacterized protein n=1 Tax=Anguilla anguilla TaxID=7936 RepID=A0A0E9WEL5_ANGAN
MRTITLVSDLRANVTARLGNVDVSYPR